jgi:RNA polymerase sigma factor (sigma-70 family)
MSRLSGSLRALFGVGTLSGLTDGQLLERFVRGRSGVGDAIAEAEAAFTALVERHGPMVLKVCASILGDRHDAEDACQATFLVLARRAEWIRRGDSVASWLYGVARRIAARARRDLARRRGLERRRLERTGFREPVSATPSEPCPEIYEELDRLPEAFRAAVVLCDLEGHSYEQAAGLLQCPVGTVQSRLARGRQRLRVRLERRGIAPAVIGIGSGPYPMALSPQLTAAIARAALGIGVEQTISAAAPATVAAWAGAEVRRQVMSRVIMTSTMLVMAGVIATAAIGLAAARLGDEPKAQAPAAARKAEDGAIHVRVVDLEGNAVPGNMVEVHDYVRETGDRMRSFTTDADGQVLIPRESASLGTRLISRRGRDALAWGVAGDPSQVRPAGTEADPIVIQLLPLDHRVDGSVVDRDGRPVAGVRMLVDYLAHPTNGAVGLGTSDAALAPTVSDRAGRFVVMLPRGARAMFTARHPRYLGGTGVEPDSQTIDPAVLEPAGGIAGRVIDAATGRPVTGAVLKVDLIEYHARILGGWDDQTVSDDQGRFLFGGLEPGVYNVLLQRVPGRADATAPATEGVRVRVGADTPAELSVVEGRALRGVVTDRETGQPVPGVVVGCTGPARPRSGDSSQVRTTDDLGRFTFHVPPGEHRVSIVRGSADHRLSHRDVVIPERGEVKPVRLMRWVKRVEKPMRDVMKVAANPPAEPAAGKAAVKAEESRTATAPAATAAVDVAKAPADAPKVRTIAGHVRDPRGRPLAGVRLQIAPGPDGPGANPQNTDLPTTDREGVFLFPDLPRRPLKITLERPGFQYQQEDLPADRDEVQWIYNLIPDSAATVQPAPVQDEPIPPELRDRLTFVNLDPSGTDYLSDGPDGGGNDLNRLPRGIHKLGETYFRIGERMVHLKGRNRPDLPRAVDGIKVQARGRVLHFLHSTQGSDEEGSQIGAYVIHYADGSSEQVPLVYARDITNWWHRDPGRTITRAKPAWTGQNDTVARHIRPGLMIRLFDLAWANPHPEKEITTLDVVSAGEECDPFLVAVTVQRGQ